MSEEPNTERTTRIIDLRIPLPWVLTGLITVGFTLVSMYFNVNQLVRDVGELQITVKAGNTQVTTLAGEQALLRFRMENIEGEMRNLKSLQPGYGTTNAPPAARRTP
ncbi:hypothetical protein J2W32_004464 [Variovorax boronicumulans]|uniref:Uncharacterized protein n=1 Tax=Variovorax boronicumulans TaxID=436515 RepID=A0AAW8D651_9BURK|nr:hypothetical protein [Variovorax boronicumulans]MDP9895366.1 hypothetical protein [Variovorax boronicumulans]MDQ0055406.1 hypothetical protein [Variovorax boronicumulans]